MHILFVIVLITVIFLLVNDIAFNRKRDIYIKIVEFVVVIICVYLIFLNVAKYIAIKNNTTDKINQMGNFSQEMTVYNIDGTFKEKTTIGDFIYDAFVYDVFDGNKNISREEYNKNNITVLLVFLIYLLYWVFLLINFEKEDKVRYKPIPDEKIFETYNPLLAGCIAQNRNVMCQDIVAIILNLINKKKINLRIVPDSKIKDIGYRYYISENEKSKVRLDMLEQYVYDWIFEELANVKKGKYNVDYITKNSEDVYEIDLIKRMREFSQNTDTYTKLKELNHMTKNRLKRIGANNDVVPPEVRFMNNFLMIITLIVVTKNILCNGFDLVLTNLHVLYIMFALIFAISFIPVIFIFSLVTLEFLKNIFKRLQQVTEGYTGRILIAKSVSIGFATLLGMVIFSMICHEYYIIYDILLIGMTCLIMGTDDYMLKHEYKVLNDYYNLKRIENKIEEYSLMEDENLEYVLLWENYYAYSVAFGIPVPVTSKLFPPVTSTQILTPQNLEGIYFISKAYFEEMWGMEFYNKKGEIDINKFLAI